MAVVQEVSGERKYVGAAMGRAIVKYGPDVKQGTYQGAVLDTYERNGYDDSDFYAIVWDEPSKSIKHVMYATTRGWTYNNGARVDATPEVLHKAGRELRRQAFAIGRMIAQDRAKAPEKGKRVRVKSGRKVPVGLEGEVIWYGPGSFGGSRWSKPPMRVGIKDDQGNKHWTAASNVEVINPRQYVNGKQLLAEARNVERNQGWRSPSAMSLGYAMSGR